MSKLGNFWKTMFAGGAGVAALAALNVAIQRNASEPDESALGGEANFFRWKHGRVFYKTSGRDNFGPPLVFIHGVGAGTSFYNVIASERSIRDYAQETLFYDHRRVTDRLVANLYATSHQPGAQHAIAAFLSGYLSTDTRSPFSRLKQRVVLIWGKQDPTTPVAKGLSLQQLNPRATLEVFDYCRMMPEQEQPEKFNALVRDTFLQRSAAATSESTRN